MVDTGAEHSAVTKPVAPLTIARQPSLVPSIENRVARSFCKARSCKLGGHLVTREFLYLPECPIPLLGRDLLIKLGARITFTSGKPTRLTLRGQPALRMAVTVPRADGWRLYSSGEKQANPTSLLEESPAAWAGRGPGLARDHAPIVVDLKPGAIPVTRRQYPVSQGARLGTRDHIRSLCDAGVLAECRSPWSTPLLRVKKPGGNDYCPVQNL